MFTHSREYSSMHHNHLNNNALRSDSYTSTIFIIVMQLVFSGFTRKQVDRDDRFI